jgi:hypothetical protein
LEDAASPQPQPIEADRHHRSRGHPDGTGRGLAVKLVALAWRPLLP